MELALSFIVIGGNSFYHLAALLTAGTHSTADPFLASISHNISRSRT